MIFYLAQLIKFVLVFTFAIAAISKILNYKKFKDKTQEIVRIKSDQFYRFIIFQELLLSLLLTLHPVAHYAWLYAAALLTFYTLIIWIRNWNQERFDCNCVALEDDENKSTKMSSFLIRNFSLVLAALFSFTYDQTALYQQHISSSVGITVSLELFLWLLLVQGALLIKIMQKQNILNQDVGLLEEYASARGYVGRYGPMLFKKVPETVSLFNSGQEKMGVSEIVSATKKKVLLFLSLGNCTHCDELMPLVPRLREELNDKEMELILINRNDIPETSEHKKERDIFFDKLGEMTKELKINRYPAAVSLSADNKIISDRAFGIPKIKELVEHLASGSTRVWWSAEHSA